MWPFKRKTKFTVKYTEEEIAKAKAIIEHETKTTPKLHATNGEWKRRQVLIQMQKAFPDKTTKQLALLLEIVLQFG